MYTVQYIFSRVSRVEWTTCPHFGEPVLHNNRLPVEDRKLDEVAALEVPVASVCAAFQQEVHTLVRAAVGRLQQRRAARVVLCFYIRSLLRKHTWRIDKLN